MTAPKKSNGKTSEELQQDREIETSPPDPMDIFSADQFAKGDSDGAIDDPFDFSAMDVDEDDESKKTEDEDEDEDEDEENEDKKKKTDEEDEEEDDEVVEEEEEEEDEGEEKKKKETEEEEEEEEEEEKSEEDEEEEEDLKIPDLGRLQLILGEIDSLKRENQELRKLAEASKPGPAKKEDQVTGDKPVFGITVPDQIVELLSSGEAEQVKAAVRVIANGTAEIARKQILQEVDAIIGERIAAAQSEQQRVSAVETAQQRIERDFFDKYPRYRHKRLYRIIKMASREYMDEHPEATAWDGKIRDAVAARVEELVGFSGKAASAKSGRKGQRMKAKETKKGSAGKGSSKRRPPRQIKTGTRATSSRGGRTDLASEVQDTFS